LFAPRSSSASGTIFVNDPRKTMVTFDSLGQRWRSRLQRMLKNIKTWGEVIQ
jgi:hypothetical protein